MCESERKVSPIVGSFTSSLQGFFWIYSTKASVIILTKTSIQGISTEY